MTNKVKNNYNMVVGKIIKDTSRGSNVSAMDIKNTAHMLSLIDDYVYQFRNRNNYNAFLQVMVANIIAAELAVKIISCPAQPIIDVTKMVNSSVAERLKGIILQK